MVSMGGYDIIDCTPHVNPPTGAAQPLCGPGRKKKPIRNTLRHNDLGFPHFP